MSHLVPGMASGVFVSNAPKYDHLGRPLCHGLPTVWQKGSVIVNTEDDHEYVSTGTQWDKVRPANPPVEVYQPPPEVTCPSCNTLKDIPADDYMCAECRTAL